MFTYNIPAVRDAIISGCLQFHCTLPAVGADGLLPYAGQQSHNRSAGHGGRCVMFLLKRLLSSLAGTEEGVESCWCDSLQVLFFRDGQTGRFIPSVS